MSYIVEQKIKGRIYLYEVTSYWDKKKQQSRQKRKYIGPKERIEKKKVKLTDKSEISSKSIGDIFLLKNIANKIGLTDILKKTFSTDFLEILNLSFYNICNATAGYLYNYWHDEHDISGRSLYSEDISALYNKIGDMETSCNNFMSDWSKSLNSDNSVYYDITSISSYGRNNSFLEWGYNRDGENLEQINIGSVHCRRKSLPMFYRLFPGSINDVTTLQNSIKYFNAFDLKKSLLTMDRGFFSKDNLISLHNNNLRFIQSMPLWLKNSKKLIRDNKDKLLSSKSAFDYNEEILYHQSDIIVYDDTKFKAHIYFDEKLHTEQKHNFLKELFTIEKKHQNIKFNSQKSYDDYLEDNIAKKYHNYFTYDKKTKYITQNTKSIEDHIDLFGHFIIITNDHKLSEKEILSHYRNKDIVEKGFHGLKTSLDGDRIRVHSDSAMKGKLFIKFISMILYCYLIKHMRETKLNKSYSTKEILFILKKLKLHKVGNEQFLSETTKKQKNIFEKFNIKTEEIESSLLS